MAQSTSTPQPVSLFTRIVIALILVVCLGLGVYLTGRGLERLEASIASTSWPTTEGIITASSLKVTVNRPKKGGKIDPDRQPSRTYAPDIKYEYTVNDKKLTGTRVSIEDASIGTRDSAQRILDQYPAGKTVTVSYDPRQPENSVLEPGNWVGTYRWFLPGGALLLIPLLLLRAILFDDRKPTPWEVRRDPNHPARAHLLNGMLMHEEIVQWEPGQIVHIRRARVGFLRSIVAAVIVGLLFGILLGLLPAIYLLSGRGVIFIGQFYLAVSAVLALATAIGLILHGRRREYLLDWSLGSIQIEIGWSRNEAPLENITELKLSLPAPGSQRNPVVDAHTIQAKILGKTYTLLETSGLGLDWGETREKLVKLISELAESLNVPWNESHVGSKR